MITENEKTINSNELAKIENEYDIKIANEAYSEYIKSGKKSKPIEELWKELDI